MKALFLRPPGTLTVTVLLAVAVLLAFGAGLGGDFVMDDRPQVLENPHLDSRSSIPGYFTSGVWANTGVDDPPAGFLYRPLFLFWLYVQHRFFGEAPIGYHVASLLVHLANSILLFHILRRTLAATTKVRAWMPVAAAMLFAVHPLHVECVSWISGVTDPLAAFFVLGSFLQYLEWREDSSVSDLALSLGLLAAGLLAKEVAVALPFLLLVHALLNGGLARARGLWPWFVVVVAYLGVRQSVLGQAGQGLQFDPSSAGRMLLYACGYLRLMLLPWPLEYYYSPPGQQVVGSLSVVLVAGAATALVTLLVRRRECAGPVAFGVAWILLFLGPALSLAFLDSPRFALRVTYLPVAGAAFVVAHLMARLPERRAGRVLSVSVVVALVLTGLSARETFDWTDELAFYSAARVTSPDHPGPASGLAEYHYRTGDLDSAVTAYRDVVRTGSPDDRVFALSNIGEIEGRRGRVVESRASFLRALEISPRHSPSLVGMGNLAMLSGDRDAALLYFREAVDADPSNAVALRSLQRLQNPQEGRHPPSRAEQEGPPGRR
ncbi:MAG: tetratricopeptide repeat protein [Planctomycetota bacterium]